MDDRGFVEVGPSWKFLFAGSCVVIGGFVGWWTQGVNDALNGLHEEHTKLVIRHSELEAGQAEAKWQREYTQREIEDVRHRMVEIERILNGRHAP